MSRRLPPVVAALVAALVVLVTAACTTTPEGTGPAPGRHVVRVVHLAHGPARGRSPTTGPAEQGACYDLSYDEAVAPTASLRDVDCAADHTAQSFHVGRLERVVGGRLLAVDARRLQDQVATTCPELLAGHVGGTEEQQRLSMLRSVWFTPTVKQSDAGADWFRCDVIAVARDSQLLPLTGDLAGVLATEVGRDRYGMCGTAEPGTDGFERVACAESHSWRALRTVVLTGEDYPGEDAAQAAGEGPCTDAARAQAADPLDFQWGYEWPTEDQWAMGQTFGICWAPSA